MSRLNTLECLSTYKTFFLTREGRAVCRRLNTPQQWPYRPFLATNNPHINDSLSARLTSRVTWGTIYVQAIIKEHLCPD